MAWLKFDHRVKVAGKFYEAGQKIKVDDADAPVLKEAGAEEVEIRSGRPRKQSSEDWGSSYGRRN